MRFKVAFYSTRTFQKGKLKNRLCDNHKTLWLIWADLPKKTSATIFCSNPPYILSRSLCFIPSSFSLHLKALHGSLPPCSSHHVWTSYEDFCLLFIKKVARGEGRTSHMIIQKYKTLRKLPPEQVKEITSTNKIHYELDMKINIWKWLFWVDPTSMYDFHQ